MPEMPARAYQGTAVSVAMATYNGMRFLDEQLRSVLDALAPQDELVIVDDASTDGTWQHLLAIDDPRVSVHRNESNLGVRRSFERVMALTTHDVVFLADQDDVWERDKRDEMVQLFVRDARIMVVVSDATVIDDSGRQVLDSFMATRHGFDGSFGGTLLRNRFLGCAMAVRRRVIDVALPIPASAPMHDMWIGAIGSLLGRVGYVDRPLLRYRRHGGNVSPSTSPSRRQALSWRIDLLVGVLSRVAARLCNSLFA